MGLGSSQCTPRPFPGCLCPSTCRGQGRCTPDLHLVQQKHDLPHIDHINLLHPLRVGSCYLVRGQFRVFWVRTVSGIVCETPLGASKARFIAHRGCEQKQSCGTAGGHPSAYGNAPASPDHTRLQALLCSSSLLRHAVCCEESLAVGRRQTGQAGGCVCLTAGDSIEGVCEGQIRVILLFSI